MCDQNKISPCSINSMSSRQVMRIKTELSMRGFLVDPIPNSLIWYQSNCMAIKESMTFYQKKIDLIVKTLNRTTTGLNKEIFFKIQSASFRNNLSLLHSSKSHLKRLIKLDYKCLVYFLEITRNWKWFNVSLFNKDNCSIWSSPHIWIPFRKSWNSQVSLQHSKVDITVIWLSCFLEIKKLLYSQRHKQFTLPYFIHFWLSTGKNLRNTKLVIW